MDINVLSSCDVIQLPNILYRKNNNNSNKRSFSLGK